MGRIKAPQNVHARGFPRSARSHNRNKLPFTNPEINSPQGDHRGLTCSVYLGDAPELQKGAVLFINHFIHNHYAKLSVPMTILSPGLISPPVTSVMMPSVTPVVTLTGTRTLLRSTHTSFIFLS